jgi:hypothetical protein
VELGDYTDSNVYWLYADSAAVSRAAARSSAPASGYTIPTFFNDTAHHEVDSRFILQVPADGLDHWYEEPPIAATGGVRTSKTFTVATPGLSASVSDGVDQGQASRRQLRQQLPPHDAHGERDSNVASGPVDWSGFTEFVRARVVQPVVAHGPHQRDVKVSRRSAARPIRAPPATRSTTNWIEITYGRSFRVDTDADGDGTVLNDQTLTFSVPNQNAQFHVTGLTQNVAAIYEITRTLSGTPLVDPVRITGRRSREQGRSRSISRWRSTARCPHRGASSCRPSRAGRRRGVLVPAAVEQDTALSCPTYCVSNLHSPGTGADWLVIANGSFLDSTPGSAWQQLLARRASQGLAVKVVDVEDVYDEFSYGIADPQAIHDFLAYVYASWPRPSGVPAALRGPARRRLVGLQEQLPQPVARNCCPATCAACRTVRSWDG